MLVHPMRAWVSVTSRKQHWDNDNNVLVFFAIIVIKKEIPQQKQYRREKNSLSHLLHYSRVREDLLRAPLF